MKYVLILLSLCLLGCTSKQQPAKNEAIQMQSIDTCIYAPQYAKEHPTEFGLVNDICKLYLETTDNKEAFDKEVTNWLDEYAKSQGEVIPANSIADYQLRQDITDSLTIEPDYLDYFYQYFWISYVFQDYLYYHYQRLLYQTVEDGELLALLKEEEKCWEQYYNQQYRMLDLILFRGSASNIETEVSVFKSSFYYTKLKILLGVYFALTNSDYQPAKDYQPLKPTYFDKAYNVIKERVTEEEGYSREKQTESVEQEQKAWENLIKSRKAVSKHLNGTIQTTYDNATYYLQKSHLVDLKNEFMNYGAMPSSIAEAILDMDCSYEELLNFDLKNFQ